MYNIKLIPYLALYKYMFTLLHRSFIVKLNDFGPSNIQLFLMFPIQKQLSFQNHLIPIGIWIIVQYISSYETYS